MHTTARRQRGRAQRQGGVARADPFIFAIPDGYALMFLRSLATAMASCIVWKPLRVRRPSVVVTAWRRSSSRTDDDDVHPDQLRHPGTPRVAHADARLRDKNSKVVIFVFESTAMKAAVDAAWPHVVPLRFRSGSRAPMSSVPSSRPSPGSRTSSTTSPCSCSRSWTEEH
jgi:hypothetical protein